jgi:hypothetical protein
MDFLAQRVLPEECRVFTLAVFLLLDDLRLARFYLEDRGPDLRAELRQHSVALEGLDDNVLEVVDLLHLDLNLRF